MVAAIHLAGVCLAAERIGLGYSQHCDAGQLPPRCEVKQIRVAWAEDGSRFTELFEASAIQVLKAVRSKIQAQWLTALSWDQVDRIMARVVSRGLERRSLDNTIQVGLDKKSFGKGHDYVSVLHDIAGKRVLDIVPERTREAADALWATVFLGYLQDDSSPAFC